jgi:hypothetical protein
VSAEALDVAIREAIAARTQHRPTVKALLGTGPQQTTEGNRGYLVREGRPTIKRSMVWIRVHEPEPALPP